MNDAGAVRGLWQRLARHGRTKLVLLVALPVVFGAGYFSLQHVTLVTPVSFRLGALDRAVGFSPRWIYAYQSLYLLMPLPPLLATSRLQLRRYRRGFLRLAAASFLVFAVFPVVAPRPDGTTGVAAFDLLTRFEGTLNAFPSLHAGLLAYTLCFAAWAFRDEVVGGPRVVLVAIALLWATTILYATLATKQHYALDLPAGIVLGWLSHKWSGATFRTKETRDHGPTTN